MCALTLVILSVSAAIASAIAVLPSSLAFFPARVLLFSSVSSAMCRILSSSLLYCSWLVAMSCFSCLVCMLYCMRSYCIRFCGVCELDVYIMVLIFIRVGYRAVCLDLFVLFFAMLALVAQFPSCCNCAW